MISILRKYVVSAALMATLAGCDTYGDAEALQSLLPAEFGDLALLSRTAESDCFSAAFEYSGDVSMDELVGTPPVSRSGRQSIEFRPWSGGPIPDADASSMTIESATIGVGYNCGDGLPDDLKKNLGDDTAGTFIYAYSKNGRRLIVVFLKEKTALLLGQD